MKKILVVLFLSVAMQAFAESDAIKSFEKLKTLQADFVQVNEVKGFGEDVYKGHVLIIMKDKALWDYSEPYISWYLFKKGSVEQFDEINNQLIKYGAKSHTESIPLQVLMDFSKMKVMFDVVFEDDKIKLTPKKDIGITLLTIEMQEDKIKRLKSEDGTGNNSTITFSNMKINEEIPASAFKKQLPKGVEVFDMN